MNLNTSFATYKKASLRRSRSSSTDKSLLSVPNSFTNDKEAQHERTCSASLSNFTQVGTAKVTKYSVLYRKFTAKKNKTWEGDGVLQFNRSTNMGIIKNEDGIVIARLKDASKFISRNIEFRSSGYEFEIDDEITSSEFSGNSSPLISVTSNSNIPLDSSRYKTKNFVSPLISRSKANNSVNAQEQPEQLPKRKLTVPLVSAQKPITTPLQGIKKRKVTDAPLYDTSMVENPLFMPDLPRSIDESEIPRKVVIDPLLSEKLRPHQREGVTFMYSCVMGISGNDIRGAILADEMGLGKTLQTITLIWTLLRQSHIAGTKPVADKVLICCPVSLVNNWKNEFNKWLGLNRLGICTINNNKYLNEIQDIQLFARNRVHQVMIIGYEKMQSMSEHIKQVKFDLLVCDEAHRLKNSDNKTIKTLESFNIRRRILLSGTPIQNDLTEFYTMANFTNPGILGDLKTFQKEFIRPILDSRDSNCRSTKVIEKGRAKSLELMKITERFILRRSNAELTSYLPKRSDYIVFVPPTPLQLQLFKTIIETKKFKLFIENETTQNSSSSFNLINTFRKICNSPSLLQSDGFFLEISERNTQSQDDVEFRRQLGKKVKSGKIMFLIKLLGLLHSQGDEKVVIVSNFTSTLDIIETLFKSLNLKFCRLDGSTASNERMKIVDRFNKSKADDTFAILLSAKAGGVGLNLVGASRLILFDNDWNPAVDLQAIARIHRDGQKRDVKIYRLLTNGCMDEKIFQRQLVKMDLSDKFLDQRGGEKELFDRSDIKDIFNVQFEKIKSNSYCNTHELMCCDCDGKGTNNEIDQEDSTGTNSDDENESNDLTDIDKRQFMSALSYADKYPNASSNPEDELLRMKRKKLRRCMKGYKHINGLGSKERFISTDDDILNALINNQDPEKPLISYVFGKF